jgi:hypothetical protein
MYRDHLDQSEKRRAQQEQRGAVLKDTVLEEPPKNVGATHHELPVASRGHDPAGLQSRVSRAPERQPLSNAR